jgi:hypothetical protein
MERHSKSGFTKPPAAPRSASQTAPPVVQRAASPLADPARVDALSGSPTSQARAARALQRSHGNQFTAAILQRKCACAACTDCDRKHEGDSTIQRQAAGSAHAPAGIPESVTTAMAAASGGQPLPTVLREQMESRFGRSFESVRVFTDLRAADATRSAQARAFTSGDRIYFANGEYQPQSEPGRELIAHELTHVVQQRSGRVALVEIGSPDDALEHEASAAATAVIRNDRPNIATPDTAHALRRSTPPSVQRKPDPAPTGGTAEPQSAAPDADLVAEREQAGSIYNKAVNGWTFLAQQQVLAIDSIYTEAKKPDKPSLEAELLTVLAEAALAAALGGIGGLIAVSIERKITQLFISKALGTAARFRDASGRFVTTEIGRAAAASASLKTAKFVAESAKDAMKDGVKSLAKPKIRQLLSDGKAAIDAFFEGQKITAVDTGKMGSDTAEDKRGGVLNNPNPVPTAQAIYEGMNSIYDDAVQKQKNETLKKWLIYQAGLDAKIVGPGKVGAGTTNLSGETWPGMFGSYVPGILYVVVNNQGRIRKAVLKGSTANYVALLEDKPLNEMGIPVIIDFDFPNWDDFYINVNERGFLWLIPSNGGDGNTYLRIENGALEGIQEDALGNLYSTYSGGDPVKGAFSLWYGRIGSQKIKGILNPDK